MTVGNVPQVVLQVIAQKRLEGVRDKTEETIAKNPRMPAQRLPAESEILTNLWPLAQPKIAKRSRDQVGR